MHPDPLRPPPTPPALPHTPHTRSRGQVFDVLSSMSNISGYRAVTEASHAYGAFFCGQITAAGRIPPTKVTPRRPSACTVAGCCPGVASAGHCTALC